MKTQTTIVSLLGLLLLFGCDFTKFDDLADKAPATRVEEGNGTPLLGFAKPDGAEGGIFLMASTRAPGGIAQVLLDPTGGVAVNKTGTDDYVDLNKLNLDGYFVRSFAPAWADAGSGLQDPGPLAFIGATAGQTGKVQMVDTDSWRANTLIAEENVADFGAALALTRFSDPSLAHDFVVGAKGSVYLIDGSGHPLYPATSRVACMPEGGLASYVYSVVAAGQSGSNTSLAVVAAPEANFVSVLSNLDGGVIDTANGVCAPQYDQIVVPSGALQFGAALLVDDLDGDLDLDVVVGAPEQAGGGAVYIYDTQRGWDANQSGQAIKLVPPSGEEAALFGASLAVGTFDGVKRMLAVGAPGSDGDAGKVFLYDLGDLTVGATSFTPRGVVALDKGGDKLGMGLARVPFKTGATTRDLLIVGAKSSALILWANTTGDHKDYRTNAP